MSKVKFKDVINPKKWRSVTVSILRNTLDKLDGECEIPEKHIIEQQMFRYLSCGPCVENMTCVDCGCNTEGKIRVAKETCSLDNWPETMPADEWENFKYEWGIIFDVESNYPNTFKATLDAIPLMGETIELGEFKSGEVKNFILTNLVVPEFLVETIKPGCSCTAKCEVRDGKLFGEYTGENLSEAVVNTYLEKYKDGKVPFTKQVTIYIKDGQPITKMDAAQKKQTINRDKKKHVITLKGVYILNKKEDEV